MISLVVAAVLLLIHALVCLMLWTLMKLGLLPVRGHMLAVIVLVPLWGPLLVVLLSVRSAVFGEGLKESALESLRFNDELHRSILVHDRDADAGVDDERLLGRGPARGGAHRQRPGIPAPPNAIHAHRRARRVPGAVAGG